jgi:hypothetical protein
VVETLQTSLGTAVTMSSFLIFGVILCILTLLRGLRTAEREKAVVVMVIVTRRLLLAVVPIVYNLCCKI